MTLLVRCYSYNKYMPNTFQILQVTLTHKGDAKMNLIDLIIPKSDLQNTGKNN